MSERGIRIPKEVGIIGYDNVNYSKYLSIPLTTVDNPGYEMGLKAAEIMIKKIKSKNSLKTDKIILKPKLVIRESA